jgi:peptidylprolyl isomerase
MVIKKGTVAIVNYSVFRGSCSGDTWEDLPDDFQTTGLPMVDKREHFRFRFGMDEIEPEIESRLRNRSCVVLGHKGLIYVVQMEDETGSVHMSLDEIFNELVQLKQLGNDCVKSGQIDEAYKRYTEAIELMTSPDFNRRTERDIREVFVPLYLNQALCCLKTERISQAIECCYKVLEVDERNVKALYRRSLARIENRELGGAKRDLLLAHAIDSQNTEVKEKLEEVKYLEKVAMDQSQKEMYARMVKSSLGTRVRIVFNIDGTEWALVLQLFDKKVPRSVQNFKQLVPRYIKCSVFKAVKDQFFQTGDYEFNDGSGGNAAVFDRDVNGRKFMNDEDLKGLHAEKGVVGMANYGRNSNNSQFYITLGPCPHMDGENVVIGYVAEGMETLNEVNRLASADMLDSRPRVPITISQLQLVD